MFKVDEIHIGEYGEMNDVVVKDNEIQVNFTTAVFKVGDKYVKVASSDYCDITISDEMPEGKFTMKELDNV